MSFVVLVLEGCPYCESVLNHMKLNSLNHNKYVAGENFSFNNFKRKFGDNATYPRVYKTDSENNSINFIGGSDDFHNYMKNEK